jgi:hypothetical protein
VTAKQHIISRHLSGLAGVSQYFGPTFFQVSNIDRLTMLFGTQVVQGGDVVITLNLSTLPFFSDFPGRSIGTDANGNATATNRLVVLDDCTTVLTSYPVANVP